MLNQIMDDMLKGAGLQLFLIIDHDHGIQVIRLTACDQITFVAKFPNNSVTARIVDIGLQAGEGCQSFSPDHGLSFEWLVHTSTSILTCYWA
ncbi:MAG TPA: hypothetical protein VGP45_08870 [Marinobacter sp.]|nr:hypothetical protein [Marinobacter sp.]